MVVAGSYDASLAHLLAMHGIPRAGFEAAHLTVNRLRWLDKTLASVAARVELVATEGIVEVGRVVKDEYEIAVLREAGQRLSRVASDLLDSVQSRDDRARIGVCDRSPHARRRIQPTGIRDHRRKRAQRGAAARATHRAKVDRR